MCNSYLQTMFEHITSALGLVCLTFLPGSNHVPLGCQGVIQACFTSHWAIPTYSPIIELWYLTLRKGPRYYNELDFYSIYLVGVEHHTRHNSPWHMTDKIGYTVLKILKTMFIKGDHCMFSIVSSRLSQTGDSAWNHHHYGSLTHLTWEMTLIPHEFQNPDRILPSPPLLVPGLFLPASVLSFVLNEASSFLTSLDFVYQKRLNPQMLLEVKSFTAQNHVTIVLHSSDFSFPGNN